MARATYTQGNFLGGEWGPDAQGRLDLPTYHTALAKCRNMVVSESGSLVRRSGTRWIGHTYAGLGNAFVYSLPDQQYTSYVFEQTFDSVHQYFRPLRGGHFANDNANYQVTSISSASPCVITLNTAAPWNSSDQIHLQLPPALDGNPTKWSVLMNRQFTVTKIDTTHFSLADMVTGAPIDGGPIQGAPPTITWATRIPKFTNTTMDNLGGTVNLTLIPLVGNGIVVPVGSGPPLLLSQTATQTNSAYAQFAFTTIDFVDGPYLNLTPDTCTLTSLGGNDYTFTATSGTFTSAQIGDPISINVIANAWSAATDYGDTPIVVTDQSVNAQFVNINVAVQTYSAGTTSTPVTTNLNNLPSQSPNYWAPFAKGSINYGATITAVASATSITIEGNQALPVGLGSYFPFGYHLAYFSTTRGVWPRVAMFHEGRLIFGDIINGINASMVYGFNATTSTVTMSPTDAFGNVLDDSGISEILLTTGNSTPVWMIPDANGILVGTQSGEWLIQATTLGEPITPTSFQAHEFTKYGSATTTPNVTRPGIGIVFVDRYNQRLMEYITDPFTQKFSGRPLNLYTKHLARADSGGLLTLAYSETPEPIIWMMGAEGGLLGCTYRRVSSFTTELPLFFGFHLHTLGSGAGIYFVTNSFTSFGSEDQQYLITQKNGIWHNECLEPLWDNTDTLFTAWPVDSGVTGINYGQTQNGGNDTGPLRPEGCLAIDMGNGTMVLGGFWDFIGETLTAWIGGVDMGDYLVDATGCITIPYASDAGGVATLAYLKSLDGITLPLHAAIWPSVTTYPIIPLTSGGGTYYVPGVVGYKFTSEVQRLRPDTQDEAKTSQGTGSGELKRHHWYSLLVSAAVANTILVGTDPDLPLYPATLINYKTGQPTPINQLFSGVHRDTIESDYDLDGQLYLRLERPAPFALSALTGLMETSEI